MSFVVVLLHQFIHWRIQCSFSIRTYRDQERGNRRVAMLRNSKFSLLQVFMVELTRGWNSRLGFSLQPEGNHTVISVVHPDSVAAKDGRLKRGDVLLMVSLAFLFLELSSYFPSKEIMRDKMSY